jgi:putative protein-disulfide isomerase
VFVYVADPMCSWCYGFGPEMAAVVAGCPQHELTLVMGGLRPHNTAVMDEALRSHLRRHWQEVQSRTGLPFDLALLDRDDFVYDTEPACRAVVTARELAPTLAWPLLRAIQRAFYERGRDVTQHRVLADLYAQVRDDGSAPDAAAFDAALASAAMRSATRADFAAVQRWGITGFPTLLLVRGQQAHVVAAGYTEAAGIVERVISLESAPH